MLHFEFEWPLNNILIADTSLAQPGPQPSFKAWGAKMHFQGGKYFCFCHMFKKNFMSATKFGETKNDLEATAAE